MDMGDGSADGHFEELVEPNPISDSSWKTPVPRPCTGSASDTIQTAVSSVEMGIASTGGFTFPNSNSEVIQGEETTSESSTLSQLSFAVFARYIGQLVMLLTFLLHIVSVVVCVVEGQRFWVVGLALLFFFDIYACFCCLKGGVGCSFWKRSFDRCMVGVISAITVFYGYHDDCPQVIEAPFRIVFYVAGWVSVMSVAFAAMEIDSSSNNEVARDVARSPLFAIRYIALRACEASTKVSTWVLFCLILRPLLGKFIETATRAKPSLPS